MKQKLSRSERPSMVRLIQWSTQTVLMTLAGVTNKMKYTDSLENQNIGIYMEVEFNSFCQMCLSLPDSSVYSLIRTGWRLERHPAIKISFQFFNG